MIEPSKDGIRKMSEDESVVFYLANAAIIGITSKLEKRYLFRWAEKIWDYPQNNKK